MDTGMNNYSGVSLGADLLRRLPSVARARDFHLYLANGRRLTDLWLMGGAAILGHKPSRVTGELKNAAERGLFAPFPHAAEGRLIKALVRLFPAVDNGAAWSFRLYGNKLSMEEALKNAGWTSLEIPDPAFSSAAGVGTSVSIWRPFLGKRNLKASIYIPVLSCFLQVLVLDKSVESSFPPGDLIPPFVLAPAARAVWDLLAAGETGGRPRFGRIEKAIAGNKKWRRQGVYLCRTVPETDWDELWTRFVDSGFLLPPHPSFPLILPGTLSPGEEARLSLLLT